PKSIKFTRQAITLCRKNQLWSGPVKNIFLQLQSDVYYKLKDDKNAQNSYLKYLEGLGDDTETFDYAWANYRLGLLSKDPAEAEEYFRKSSPIFDLLGYQDLCARSEGERGVALVQLDRPSEFVRVAEWMCRRYYLRNKSNFGPAVTMVMRQLTRLICNLERPVSLDNVLKIATDATRNFPDFKVAKDYALKKIDELRSRAYKVILWHLWREIPHYPKHISWDDPIYILTYLSRLIVSQ
ncbi:unnamed protein product, partial [marine sediment metagenome]